MTNCKPIDFLYDVISIKGTINFLIAIILSQNSSNNNNKPIILILWHYNYILINTIDPNKYHR